MDHWQLYFKRGDKVTWRAIEDDCILLHLESGFYYTISGIGRFIWESLDGATQLPAIHSAILERYEVDAEAAKNDILEIINDLLKEDLVEYETNLTQV